MTEVSRRTQLLLNGQRTLGSLPRAIDELASIFANDGHELALVGGPVRDAFLGMPIHDWDLTTDAHPDKTQLLLGKWSHNVWDVGKEFGTIGAARDSLTVEVTTYRTDEYEVGSRKPAVSYGDTLDGDLTRRDFTVNAMAVRLPSLELVDPCGGLDDLAEGILRTPVSAEQSFDDDPLRIMRAARFSAQLGFDPTMDVIHAMEDMAERLDIVSAERIWAELTRLIASPAPRRGIELMVHTRVAEYVLPELLELVDTADGEGRHKDVYAHSLTVLDQAIALESGPECPIEDALLGGELPGPDVTLRLAALLHDIGKPATRRFEANGTVTFRGHDVVGARMVRKRLKALKADKETRTAVARLVELHLRAFGFADVDWTDSAVRRFVRDAGEELPRLLRLIRADVTSRNRRKVAVLEAGNDELARRIAELAEREALEAIRPDLSGDDIMEILGLKPGRIVGEARAYMLDIRLDEGPLEREEAIARLKEWWAQRAEADADAGGGAPPGDVAKQQSEEAR